MRYLTQCTVVRRYDKYLEDRTPLPINVNAFLTWKQDPHPLKNDQASRAASLITAATAFHRTMRDGHLKPDIFHTKPHLSQHPLYENIVRWIPPQVSWYAGYAVGAYALDMFQYARLFQSTRVPQAGKDVLVSYSDTRHIVVQHGADFYKFDVVTPEGGPVSQAQIEANIRAILEAKPSATEAVGLLTTMDRDEWAAARQHLTSLSPNNAEALAAVDSAVFVASLEPSSPEGLVSDSRCALHGTGRDRWFDKSFQLTVAKNGRAAVNFEHAWGDGAAVLRFFDEVFTCANGLPLLPPPDTPAALPPASINRLDFAIDSHLSGTITKAAARFDAQIQSGQFEPLETDAISGQFLRKHKIGGDGTMQMAFQLAHYRMYGHSAST